MAPSLFWTKIPLYLLLGMGAVFTLVLAASLIADPGCANSPTTPHLLDGVAYAGLAVTLGVIGVVSMNALARFVRAHVRSKTWLTTAGAGLLTLLPVLLAVGGDVALGFYVYFQDLFLECLALFPSVH